MTTTTPDPGSCCRQLLALMIPADSQHQRNGHSTGHAPRRRHAERCPPGASLACFPPFHLDGSIRPTKRKARRSSPPFRPARRGWLILGICMHAAETSTGRPAPSSSRRPDTTSLYASSYAA